MLSVAAELSSNRIGGVVDIGAALVMVAARRAGCALGSHASRARVCCCPFPCVCLKWANNLRLAVPSSLA